MANTQAPGPRFAGRRRGLLGKDHLNKFAGGPRSAMNDFLIFLARRDVYYMEHEFDANAIDTTFWTTNAGTGATAFAAPATKGLHGTIAGATGTNGTAGNRVVNIYGDPIFKGDNYCGMQIQLQVDAVTNIEWGVGFIDTHGTITTPVVLVGDIDDASSLASGMGDAALVYQDTAQTLTTTALVTLGSTPYSAASNALGTFAPTAATYFNVRVQLDGDNVYAAIANQDGSSYFEVSKNSGIEGGTLVRPFLVISGPTSSTRNWTIDRWALWGER